MALQKGLSQIRRLMLSDALQVCFDTVVALTKLTRVTVTKDADVTNRVNATCLWLPHAFCSLPHFAWVANKLSVIFAPSDFITLDILTRNLGKFFEMPKTVKAAPPQQSSLKELWNSNKREVHTTATKDEDVEMKVESQEAGPSTSTSSCHMSHNRSH